MMTSPFFYPTVLGTLIFPLALIWIGRFAYHDLPRIFQLRTVVNQGYICSHEINRILGNGR
jgi:hypothetical protein